MTNEVDVAVVGAGPVGLLTAVELALGGARVVVLERLAEASTANKALTIGPLGAEALQRRGMAGAIAAAEARNLAVAGPPEPQAEAAARPTRSGGHFAGLSLIRADAQREPDRQPRLVDQQAVEAMLADQAEALGIEVRRQSEVTGFVEQGDAIEVKSVTPTDEERLGCHFLVGCDGGRSLIRKLAGFSFPGTPTSMTMYQAVAEVDRPELLGRGWRRTPGGMFSHGPFPGRFYLLDFGGPPVDREASVTRQEVEDVLRRVSETDVRVKKLESASRWADNTRLVDTYRLGRVLLAGDAAHVHTPFGGQGLSLGLVDAANLGWKLAAVIRGDMPESLLDTYTAERRSVAEAVLANTLAQMAIMRPDPQSGAMRDIIASLTQFDDANRYIGEMVSGSFTRYNLGTERDEVGRLIGDRPVRLGGAFTSLYDVMADGDGVLLDASNDRKALHLVSTRKPRIRCVAIGAGRSILIRPDACVAWAGEENSTDGLEEAFRRWFGPVLDDGSPGRARP